MTNEAPLREQQHVIEAFAELAPKYEKKMDSELNLFWGWSYRELIQTLLEDYSLVHAKRILDLATGKLIIPRAIAAINPTVKQIVGLDITFRMLQLGKTILSRNSRIRLLCASALEIPVRPASFSLITCTLATHHMDGRRLLSEIHHILDWDGQVVIVDVGASKTWMNPIVRGVMRVLAFLYFMVRENVARAWAEAEQWGDELKKAGADLAHLKPPHMQPKDNIIERLIKVD